MRKNLIIISICIIIIAFIYTALEVLVPVQPASTYLEIQIPKGTTFRQAVEILARERLVNDKNLFLFLGRLTGIDTGIKAGFYSIWGSMNPLDIFRVLRNGQVIEYEITIVEGDSLYEIADKMSDLGLISREDFLSLAHNPGFLAYEGIDADSAEGYLFPDTYKIPKGIEPEEAIGLMIDTMREKFSGKLADRAAELGMTEHEVLTLASIIEKEAILDKERPLISAVYHNRLKKNMRLQADPTAIYGIKSFREKITKADLRRKTPYNTYIFEGLPPGPIASPGLKSIIAALYPADVPYLYFVSKDDLTHHFSSTAEEHLKAVRQYREWKRESRSKKKDTGDNDSS